MADGYRVLLSCLFLLDGQCHVIPIHARVILLICNTRKTEILKQSGGVYLFKC